MRNLNSIALEVTAEPEKLQNHRTLSVGRDL